MDLKFYSLMHINIWSSPSVFNKKVTLKRKIEEAVKMHSINPSQLYCELLFQVGVAQVSKRRYIMYCMSMFAGAK